MRKNLFFQPALLVLCFGLFSAIAGAQEVKVDVDDPAYEDLESPQFGGNTEVKKFKPKNWLEVEVKLKVKAARGFKGAFLNRLDIRWYVAVDNPEGKGTILLEKTATYLNVPIDEDVFAAVYLAPTAIKRITGSDRAGKSNVKAVAGEITYNGAKVGVFNNGPKEWWRATSVSRSDDIPLLSKAETPFKFLWWDRYLEEQPVRR